MNSLLGAAQAVTAFMHMNSKSKVTEASKLASSEINAIRADTTNPDNQAVADEMEANRQINEEGEKQAQNQLASRQTMATMVTMAKANKNFADAKAIRDTPIYDGANSQAQYTFSNDIPVDQSADQQIIVPESTSDATTADTTTNGPTESLDDQNQINPGNLDGIGGNAPLAQNPGKDNTPGSAGGGGLSAAGNTSAAKPEGGEGQAGSGKSQQGGAYAGAGAGGARKSGSGGSGGKGVSMDNAFTDLLKKLLPGGEEDKKKNQASNLNFNDRAPAGDQAAVISRNKNIFEEIHKRYQKKSAEGAVIF
jgi:hypothetical protein